MDNHSSQQKPTIQLSNYKVLRICPSKQELDLFTDFYTINQLDKLPYQDAMEQYQQQGFPLPGGWSPSMRKLGNEATDVLPGFMLLQKKWAAENGVRIDYEDNNWPINILLSQVATIKPDVIFFYAGGFNTLPVELLREIKTKFPFVKILSCHWGDTTEDYDRFRDLDVIFYAYDYNRRLLAAAGVKNLYQSYNCFDLIMNESVTQDRQFQPSYDFIFAGSSGYGYSDHIKRYLDLVELMKRTNLKAWCFERRRETTRVQPSPKIQRSLKQRLHDFALMTLGVVPVPVLELARAITRSEGKRNVIPRLVDNSIQVRRRTALNCWFDDRRTIAEMFPDRCSSPVFGREYYELMAKSKIVFNRHQDIEEEYGNVRMFEATGVGACLLTDRRDKSPDLHKIFKLDEEIVTYSSIGECVEKMHYLLEHEDVRREIAAAGQKRTLKDHTVMNRCQQIDEMLQKTL